MKILSLAPFTNQEKDILTKTFPNHQFTFVKGAKLTQDMIDNCDMLIGNAPERIDLNRDNLKAIQLASAGSDTYVKKGVLNHNISQR